MTINKPQAQALAALLHELRPEWVIQSLLTLLYEHRDEHPFPELCTAAITVAKNPAKGPGIIFLDGPHWHPTTPQTAPRQQFLTAAEKNRLQGAQLMGYYEAKNGADPHDTSNVFHQPLISPSDLNPNATLEAFQRGKLIWEFEKRQQLHPAAIEASDPDTLEEGAS